MRQCKSTKLLKKTFYFILGSNLTKAEWFTSCPWSIKHCV